jgi:outer membrane protein assembly factor BamB
MKPKAKLALITICLIACGAFAFALKAPAESPITESDTTSLLLADIAKKDVGKLDWPQFGGANSRNNTPEGKGIPTDWDIKSKTNIKWSARLGSQTYGNVVVANGKVYCGTNNGAGYLKRFPQTVDLGCLLCFDEQTGEFLWQHSSTKLPTGRVHDWPLQGICCAPCVDGNRLWFVTSRGEVVCLDTEGFRDGKNNGPFKSEDNENKDEADVIWKFDMMGIPFGVSQHNMCSCSVLCAGDTILVNTSNGLDASHINLPSPNAPSFFAMNRDTGKVLWTSKAPGLNILHGQWSSPAFAVLGGVEQALFPGGDGWLYSYALKGDGKGNAKLLWKFDCNPKDSEWILGGRGTRNNLIAMPVVYDGHVYLAVGQDPEHGEGVGHLWCIDPTKRGDVSAELAVDSDGKPLPARRILAVDRSAGERAIANPNSAAVWHYSTYDLNGDDDITFEDSSHRSCGTVAIKNDLVYFADFSGLFHCLDAKAVDQDGQPTVYWTYDMFAAAWGSPLIVEGKVYIGDEDGDLTIFKLSKKRELINEVNMRNAVYSTPIVANNVLFISNKSTLFAITEK